MQNSGHNELVVRFDTTVYRLDAIKKAAYRLGDRVSAMISIVDAVQAEVCITSSNNEIDLERVREDFYRDVLDQELREMIREETSDIRTLLVAQAFSKVSVVDRIGELGSDEADPLGIKDISRTQSRA